MSRTDSKGLKQLNQFLPQRIHFSIDVQKSFFQLFWAGIRGFFFLFFHPGSYTLNRDY
jgi:hypothetical protein